MYKGVGRCEGGGVAGGGGREVGGGLYLPIGLFGVAMSPRSASHNSPRQDWRALRDVSPTQGWISYPYLPSSALHESHCLSRDFTQSAKPALEKQTSPLIPIMQRCMDSAWVWLLAGPKKGNGQRVTLWSVFDIQSQLYFHHTYVYICPFRDEILTAIFILFSTWLLWLHFDYMVRLVAML